MDRSARSRQIADNNDLLRGTMFITPRTRVCFTEAVYDAPDREDIIIAVRHFSKFTPDNDPHGEHDFGKVAVNGIEYFFKIDYYDLKMEYGADPYETNDFIRVMTIMRADEY